MPNLAMERGSRLRTIAERVLPGWPMADLCCDHAQLAAALVAEGRVPRAIASDVNRAPLAAAAARGLSDGVELRCGDGFATLEAGEVATVVIAGVGAALAERIIRAGEASAKLEGVRRLIVQANHGFPKSGQLRGALAELGWAIVDEAVARDQGRLYVIMVAEPGPGPELDGAARELGPVLLRRSTEPLVAAWFEHERERIERAIVGMERGLERAETLAHYRRTLVALSALPRLRISQ